MIRYVCGLMLAILTGALSPTASAQLKFKDVPGTTALPSAEETKERAAIEAAERWLQLVDRKEYAKAWEQCAPIFREKVSRQQWVEGLPKTRAPLGAVKKRTLKGAGYRQSLPGVPDGEYVTVGFDTAFEKNDNGVETMTLMLDGTTWRPIGYAIQ